MKLKRPDGASAAALIVFAILAVFGLVTVANVNFCPVLSTTLPEFVL
jgi:hypothetical protein